MKMAHEGVQVLSLITQGIQKLSLQCGLGGKKYPDEARAENGEERQGQGGVRNVGTG